jgi:hypothetical protein
VKGSPGPLDPAPILRVKGQDRHRRGGSQKKPSALHTSLSTITEALDGDQTSDYRLVAATEARIERCLKWVELERASSQTLELDVGLAAHELSSAEERLQSAEAKIQSVLVKFEKEREIWQTQSSGRINQIESNLKEALNLADGARFKYEDTTKLEGQIETLLFEKATTTQEYQELEDFIRQQFLSDRSDQSRTHDFLNG